MIQILLLILKIIGITLLAVIGFVLVLLAVILFVPVFYRVQITHTPEKTQIKARVSYLFPLLVVTAEYLKKVSYKVRIFGVALLDSDKPKKEKPPKKKEKKQKERNVIKKKKKSKNMPVPMREEDIWIPLEHPGTLPGSGTRKKPEASPKQEKTAFTEEKQSIFNKMRGKIQKIRETISENLRKWKRLWHQKQEVQRIWDKPETKQALVFAWDKLKRLLKHIFPRKIKGYVAYGADDPATTGQVLGILSVVYARTGQVLEIRPNFVEKQLECDTELKGRVQVFTLLVIAVKVFVNQELRQLVADIKGIKDIE